MLITLLPSEIARLVLNYLDEEKYSNTYESFLNECRYLEECKIYLKQGISLPKTIHGKKLNEFLVLGSNGESINLEIEKKTQSTQTPDTATNPTDEQTDTENEPKKEKDLDTSCSEPLVNDLSKKVCREPDLTCLTELIKSNDIQMENEPVSKIKLLKSPEIKLISQVRMKSPEKKIRLDVKPDIIQLSSDDDDDSDEETNKIEENKKRKILIGRNVEKIPGLSVSDLERQLNTIICDATNHLKQQEEIEKSIQNQMKPNLSVKNSIELINTISKGPPLPLGNFRIGSANLIGQMPKPMLPPLQPPTRPQIQQINKTTPIQYIQQAPFQFLQQTPIHQIQQMPNIQQCIQQASNIHNMPQQVFFLSNPNDFNLNFAPKQEQQQTQHTNSTPAEYRTM